MKKLLFLTTVAALFVAVTSCNDKMDAPDSSVVSAQISMVLVEKGDFMRGESKVTLTKDFYIGQYPVTQAQWFMIMGSNPSNFATSGEFNRPVEMVRWEGAVSITGTSGGTYMEINGIKYYEDGFIFRLNAITGKQYRLPTEAEWEYAARGGKLSRDYFYSGSNTPDDVAWYSVNSAIGGTRQTHPVGLKMPNELGIYDMSGNVFEWCSDLYSLYTTGAKTDPHVITSTYSSRVLRGGSWSYSATRAQVSYRNYDAPEDRYLNLGFRLTL